MTDFERPSPGVFRRVQGKLGGEPARVSSEGTTVAFYPCSGAPEEPTAKLKPAETEFGKVWEFLYGERCAAAILGFAGAGVILGLFAALVCLIRRGD